ncbi:MAG: NnrS family protein [Myxococcales bacterium]|nr:NnrS family protein [Myxococcales bacterium]
MTVSRILTLKRRLNNTDPYQWLFPLGIVYGLTGVGLWILFKCGLIARYPGPLHAELMMGGFFLAVASGFLMTAVPRFTGTAKATFYETVLVCALTCLALSAAVLGASAVFHGVLTLWIGSLGVFGLSRVRHFMYTPPPSFMLVGFGLSFGFLGSIVLLFSDLALTAPLLVRLARQLLLYGMCLGIVLGIGSQLLPMLMGTRTRPMANVAPTLMNPIGAVRGARIMFALAGVLLLISFVIEVWVSIQWAWFLRSLLLSGITIGYWQIYRCPSERGVMAWCLWISAWMLAIGGWPGVFVSSYQLHGIHIVFIGSLSLMIFAVATRVVLSHGGYDLKAERSSKALYVMFGCFVFALGTRLAAPFSGRYFAFLDYAALMWILGVLVWSSAFLPKLWCRKQHPEPS